MYCFDAFKIKGIKHKHKIFIKVLYVKCKSIFFFFWQKSAMFNLWINCCCESRVVLVFNSLIRSSHSDSWIHGKGNLWVNNLVFFSCNTTVYGIKILSAQVVWNTFITWFYMLYKDYKLYSPFTVNAFNRHVFFVLQKIKRVIHV